MNCPYCGKEMRQGHMLSGGGKCWLMWYPAGNRPTGLQLLKHGFPMFAKGSPEEGMVLYPWTDQISYVPALNCPECKKVLLDYDWESDETDGP